VPATGCHPRLGGHPVQIADEVGLGHGMAGRFYPDVGTPDVRVATHAQQEAHAGAAPERDHAGHSLAGAPTSCQALDLDAGAR